MEINTPPPADLTPEQQQWKEYVLSRGFYNNYVQGMEEAQKEGARKRIEAERNGTWGSIRNIC